MVYGDKKPHVVALIVPDKEFASEWADSTGNSNKLADIIAQEDFRRVIRKALDHTNENLSVIEKIRHFALTDEEFTVDNEMMTPTLKVRRHVITEKYGAQLENLYAK